MQEKNEQKYFDTVIFDIGNVLMSFQWMPYMRTLFDSEELILRINRAIWGSGLWDEMDRGVKTGEELLPEMQALDPEIAEEIAKAFQNSDQCMHRCEYAGPWIRELKARGFRTVFLSNYSRYVMNQNPDVLYFLPELDDGVFSCDVKAIKPEKEIFDIAKEKLQLDFSRSVFLDDNVNNVRAARQFGLPTLRFTEYAEMRERLEATLAGSKEFLTDPLPEPDPGIRKAGE